MMTERNVFPFALVFIFGSHARIFLINKKTTQSLKFHSILEDV